MREMGEEKSAGHNTCSSGIHVVPKLTTGRFALPSGICVRTETLPFLSGLSVVRGRMEQRLGAQL